MKVFKLSIAIVLFSFQLMGQAQWETALGTQLENLKTLDSLEQLDQSLGMIERIANSVNDNYLPKYYAAYWNIQKFWMTNLECEECVEKAEAYLEKSMAIKENSETYALKGYLYQAKINMNPMAAPILSSKAGSALDKAIEMNPENPRAALIKAQMVYYTPKMFGGGLEKAQPHFDRAVELYDAQEECEGLKPSWGKDRLEQVLEQIKNN